MEFVPEEAIRILLAVVVGGLIGAEREFRDKAAGFRTIIFITVGSALFTILSLQIGSEINPTRIAANIVTGIGFLGAGAIMREGGRVAGLTTAATIWLAAALGMGVGSGRYALTGVSTLVVLLILLFFPHLERWIDNINEARTYEIAIPFGSPLLERLPDFFKSYRLKTKFRKEYKAYGRLVIIWRINGHLRDHRAMTDALIKEEDILELKY